MLEWLAGWFEQGDDWAEAALDEMAFDGEEGEEDDSEAE